MGIPFLYSWLKRKNYRAVLQKSVPQYVSSLSLDMNGLIHNVAQIVYAYGEGENAERKKLIAQADPQILEAEFYQVLASKLSQIIEAVGPREVLVLAVDGVAPQAKIAQQRQRRFKAAKESKGEKSIFSSNAITPGTEFMHRLDNFIQRWIVSSARNLPPKVIYSSHMVPNEGEHKIIDLMRNGEINDDNGTHGSHVLYGMDADLIMLSLLAPLNNICLMREDITDIIVIDNLKLALIQELSNGADIENGINIIRDYVCIIFLIGNDFLPHMVSLSNLDLSIQTLMEIYKNLGKPITDGNGIIWNNFSEYLSQLAEEEANLLEEESKQETKYPSRMMQMATTKETTLKSEQFTSVERISKFDYSIFRAAWYKNIFMPKDMLDVFSKLMPDYNFGTSNKKLVDMVKEYLIGLNWVFRYYTIGPAEINTDYVYRYHYAPLLLDIAFTANEIGKKIHIEPDRYINNPNALIINPVHQLLAVLPLSSKKLLPEEVRHLTEKNSFIADYFPEDTILERDGVNNDWQGVLLVNFVDMGRIIDVVNRTSVFSQDRLILFSPKNNIILKRDAAKTELDEKNQKLKEFLRKGSEQSGRGRGRGRERREYNKEYNREDRGRGRGEYNKEYNRQDRGRGRGEYNKEYNKEYNREYNREDNREDRGRGGYNKEYNKEYNRQDRGRGEYRKYSESKTYYNNNNKEKVKKPITTSAISAPVFTPKGNIKQDIINNPSNIASVSESASAPMAKSTNIKKFEL